jgi:hypothetical protein
MSLGNRGVCIVAVLALSACGDSKAPQQKSSDSAARFVSGASGSAQVTLRRNVKSIERADALANIVGVSTDGMTILFAAKTAALQSLQAGDVLLMKGILARKVLATENDGEVIAVLTGPTSIGEVIQDGKIHIDAPFRFSPQAAQLPVMQPREMFASALEKVLPAARADVGEDLVDAGEKARKYGGKVVDLVKDGWKAQYSATPSAGKVDLSLVLTRDIGGFRGVITGKGYLQDFDLSSDIEVERGTLEKLNMAFKRVNGLMNITWEVGKDSPGAFNEESKIKLPGAITVPLYELLEGMPLYMEVSAAVIIQPFITGGKQYSHGSFRVTYDGAQHFTAKEGTIDPQGNVKGDIKFLEDRHISALAPVGMVVSMAAPRIELTLDPLKVLSDIQENGGLQKVMKAAAEKADAWASRLTKALEHTEVGGKLKNASSALGDVSASKMVESMKSNAMAYIQLVTTSAMTNSGMSVIAPCTHTDLSISVSVGASAQAFGQQTEPVKKDIFQKKLTRIDPPTVRLCDY